MNKLWQLCMVQRLSEIKLVLKGVNDVVLYAVVRQATPYIKNMIRQKVFFLDRLEIFFYKFVAVYYQIAFALRLLLFRVIPHFLSSSHHST